MHNPQLAFSTNEPAINVYFGGGDFKAHETHPRQLTCCVCMGMCMCTLYQCIHLHTSLRCERTCTTAMLSYVHACAQDYCPPVLAWIQRLCSWPQAHEDNHALTVLLPLSDAGTDFEGEKLVSS